MNQLSDQTYKRLFKASPGKILVLRPGTFEIVTVTDEYLNATMTRETDIVGKTLFDVFPDDPGDQRADGVRNLADSLARVQALKTVDIMSVQRYPVRHPDGTFEERYWSPVNSPVMNDVDEIEFIIHRVEDVTAIVQENAESTISEAISFRDPLALQDIILRSRELRQALSKLQEYEARMHAADQNISTLQEALARAAKAEQQRLNILESISDGFFALDKKWHITYMNRQAGILLGRSQDELRGKNLWEEFPDAVDSEYQRQYQWALEHQQTVRFQEFYAPLNKSFDVTAYAIPDGLAVYFRDVTNEREYQERLRLVDAALSRQNDIVIITEADRLGAPDGPRIVYVNDAFERLTGYAKSEVMGQTPRLLQGPETDREQLDRIRVALEHKRPIRCELLNYTKSGESYWLELDITPLIDANGHCTHFVAVERDISERREMEERLRESQKLEAVGHLTGGVAHDFNNLLTVILCNSEMLTELLDDPDSKSMAEMTLSAAQRGAELISRLMAFSRRQPLDPKPVNINQLVTAMQTLVGRTLPENIELRFIPGPNLGITEIDSGELDTALLNLVVNARDAMPDGGTLTIETANVVLDPDYASRHTEVAPGEYVMICVSDTGTGMDRATAQRVFEPFFTTKAVGKGSGLGLSMVFGFTKQSGGHIKIYSELGEGTAIKLYFPKVRGGEQASYQPTLKMKPQGGSEHILIAEDDDLVLKHLEGQLRALGYRVSVAMSGPEALLALSINEDIDLLLTDVIMPGGINGRELVDQALAIYPRLKVLFSSGYTENAIFHHGRLDPGVVLLNKPYTRLELATKVRRVLDTQQNE